jgi:hypothetical protein
MDDIVAIMRSMDTKIIIFVLSLVSGAIGFIIKTMISSRRMKKHLADYRKDMIEIEATKAELSRELQLKENEHEKALEEMKTANMKNMEEFKLRLAKEYEKVEKIANSNYSAYRAFQRYFDVIREVSCYRTVKEASVGATGDIVPVLYDQFLQMQWKNIQDNINAIRDEFAKYDFYIPGELGLRIKEFELDITNLFFRDEFSDEVWEKVSDKMCHLVAELSILAKHSTELKKVD